MSRAVLGSRWREAPLIVRALMLPSTPHAVVCDVCGASWEAKEGHACRWCFRRLQADHDWILKPPAPRGYGYASYQDLASLGYNPEQDCHNDLERWRHDLELAVEAQLITQQEGEEAWQSANQTSHSSSTSSTGTTSTTAQTQTTTPSSTASPSVAAGQQSPHRRKQAKARSSLPSQWQPPKQDT